MAKEEKNMNENTAPEEVKEQTKAVKSEKTEKPESKKAEKKKTARKNPFKSKKFKHGGLSVLFTVIFIVAIVLVNVVFNLVLDRFDIKADLTDNSIFTLSEESEEYLKGVDKKINFYVTADEDTLKASGEKLYLQVAEFLEKMTELNGGFTLDYVNLLSDPDFSKGYSETLSEGMVIVKNGENDRYRILKMADFLRYTLSDGKSYSYSEATYYVYYGGMGITGYSSIAEEEILSAIMSVSMDNPTRIAFSEGFGEGDSTIFSNIATKNAYDVTTINIDKSEKIGEDIDVVVIYAPTSDYNVNAVNKIDEWLSNGGKYGKSLIYVAASSSAVDTPNLDELLSEWGLSIGKGYVAQLDTEHAFYSGEVLPLLQDLELNKDSEYYKNMKLPDNAAFMGWRLRPVNTLWEEKSNFTNTVIASTYGENCVMFPFDADINTWKPEDSDYHSYNAIVESSKVRYDGATPYYSRIIAIGSDSIFMENFTGASNYSNAEVALSLLDTNSEGGFEKISVMEKSFTAETYQIDTGKQIGIGVTFAVIIPVIIIVIGIIVWVRRRRL